MQFGSIAVSDLCRFCGTDLGIGSSDSRTLLGASNMKPRPLSSFHMNNNHHAISANLSSTGLILKMTCKPSPGPNLGPLLL